LENFIDSANDLLPAPVGQADNATPITTIHVLLVCYAALQMIELPEALQYVDQWKTLFRTLTRLGNQSLGIAPRNESTTSLADNVNAQSSPQPNPVPYTIQPAQFVGVAFEQVQELVTLCLQEVQRHDTHVLVARPGGDFSQSMTSLELGNAYEEWLSLFTFEHCVIEDEFVEMLGRIFRPPTLDIPSDGDDLRYFRLKKLGILESNRPGSVQAVDDDTAATDDVQNHDFQNDDDSSVGDTKDDADDDQSLPIS
jgi:hypothetical protein